MLRKLHRSRVSRNITVAGLCAALMVSMLPSGAWSQARLPGEGAPGANDIPASTVNVSGFGFGHGLGMGQWGAYGYASVYHWDYEKNPGALLRRHDPRDATFSRAPGQGPSGGI